MGPLEGTWATLAKESMFEVDAGVMPVPMSVPLGNSSYFEDFVRTSLGICDLHKKSIEFVLEQIGEETVQIHGISVYLVICPWP